MSDPLIIDNPELGLTESTETGRPIDDQRTPMMGYPYGSQANLPVDDLHRHNQGVRMMEADMTAILTASILELPVYYFLKPR